MNENFDKKFLLLQSGKCQQLSILLETVSFSIFIKDAKIFISKLSGHSITGHKNALFLLDKQF